MFSIIEGPPLQQWNPARFVRKWVMTTRSADCVACSERDVIFLFGNWWIILAWFYCKYKNKKAWDQWMPVAVMRSSMPLAWVVYYSLLTIVHKLLAFFHSLSHADGMALFSMQKPLLRWGAIKFPHILICVNINAQRCIAPPPPLSQSPYYHLWWVYIVCFTKCPVLFL